MGLTAAKFRSQSEFKHKRTVYGECNSRSPVAFPTLSSLAGSYAKGREEVAYESEGVLG